jgi:hypothetical protein
MIPMVGTNETTVRAIEHDLRVAKADQYGWLIASVPGDRDTSRFNARLASLGTLLARGQSARMGRRTHNGDAAVDACSRGLA